MHILYSYFWYAICITHCITDSDMMSFSNEQISMNRLKRYTNEPRKNNYRDKNKLTSLGHMEPCATIR